MARYQRRTCGDDTDVHMHTRASPGRRDRRGHHPTATHRRDGDTTFALVGVIAFSSAMLTEERYRVTARHGAGYCVTTHAALTYRVGELLRV
jgi:hypothetical protein